VLEVEMELYFLRHGQAGERSEWDGPDEKRPLTEAGKAQTAREAAGLAKLGLTPDLILTSPLTRARQTAEIAAEGLGGPERVALDERLGPGFDRKELGRIVSEYSNRNRLMLVGHEPDFSDVVGRLIGDAKVVIKKGGLAAVEITGLEPLRGRLLWLATPQMLEAQAASTESQ
jgi:phosphohistidine phosphatase